jgi:hypothetical protein
MNRTDRVLHNPDRSCATYIERDRLLPALDAVAYCCAACSDGLAISRFGGPRARCADEQGFPSWIRPGDRPPVQRSEIAR